MNCPICNSTNVRSTEKDSRDAGKIQINCCDHCGHWCQPPDKYREIYTTGEFTQQARKTKPVPDNAKIKELDKRALKRFDYYRDYLAGMDKVLEIGSSIGSFVHVLRLSGKQAYGLEPDPDYASFSQVLYGIEQYQGLLENFDSDKKFQSICSFHVLEHVRDPHLFLKACLDLLTGDGQLLFEFPSLELHMYGSLKNTIWSPHVHYFTCASLYHLFSQYFKIERIGYYGSALFVYAKKSETPTFNKSRFQAQKRRATWNRRLVKIFPQLPGSIGEITAKQLVMQSLIFQTNRKQLAARFVKLGIFALKNVNYLRAEKGRGKITATHFSYYSGWENAGDTVLSKTVRDNFNLIQPTRWSLKNVTQPVTGETIRKINQKDYLVIGGGGLLLPDSNPNAISGWQWAISEELLDQIEVPVLVYAIGYNFFIGQQPGELFQHNLKKIIQKANFFSLRNWGSIKAVKALVGDEMASGIRFQPCPTTIIRKVDKSAPSKIKSKNVGVNIAYDRYHLRYGADIYKILDQIAIALKEISSKGYRIHNLCHLENDAKFELTLDAHNIEYQHVNLQYTLPKQTYEIYCNMELTLGTRGHAQMIPFGLNSKIISLGSHNKLKYFLEDINALDWFINLKEDIPGLSKRIINMFFEIIESKEVEDRLIFEQNKLHKVTLENYELIQTIIKN